VLDHKHPATKDYIDAISGNGPRALDWEDKPHRLIYDLCSEVQRLHTTIDHALELLNAGCESQAYSLLLKATPQQS
jgi:hypothetical protein